MFGVGHERLARSRVVVAGAVTGIVVLVPLPVHAGTPLYHAAVQYAAGSQPRDDVNRALGVGMPDYHHANVEVKYNAPDGVTVDVSESGWVGTSPLQ